MLRLLQNGQVERSELPQEAGSSARVLVTFLDPDRLVPTKLHPSIDRLETELLLWQWAL